MWGMAKFGKLKNQLKISLGKKSLQIQAKSSDFILNPVNDAGICPLTSEILFFTTCSYARKGV